jgi:hypothetical protein
VCAPDASVALDHGAAQHFRVSQRRRVRIEAHVRQPQRRQRRQVHVRQVRQVHGQVRQVQVRAGVLQLRRARRCVTGIGAGGVSATEADQRARAPAAAAALLLGLYRLGGSDRCELIIAQLKVNPATGATHAPRAASAAPVLPPAAVQVRGDEGANVLHAQTAAVPRRLLRLRLRLLRRRRKRQRKHFAAERLR